MRIALDAMGGDAAPAEIVKGAILAVDAFPAAEILLVGDESLIQRELDAAGTSVDRLLVRHAPEAIEMNESPVSALKRKPKSSIAIGFGLVAEGEADGIVSAGNTGAMVAAATLSLKLLEGVKRPGIALNFPHSMGETTLIDMGANVECKPLHLLQYAVMASVYQEAVFERAQPRVGLISVGEEREKGNKLVKETHALIEQTSLNFAGNIEGTDIWTGACDVIVCDGFVGNVILKLSEGLAEQMLTMLMDEAAKDTWTRLGAKLMKPAITSLKTRLDFAEYGGAPLLGVNGVTIICHGRSDATAIKNALGAAIRFNAQDVNGRILEALQDTRPLWEQQSESNQ